MLLSKLRLVLLSPPDEELVPFTSKPTCELMGTVLWSTNAGPGAALGTTANLTQKPSRDCRVDFPLCRHRLASTIALAAGLDPPCAWVEACTQALAKHACGTAGPAQETTAHEATAQVAEGCSSRRSADRDRGSRIFWMEPWTHFFVFNQPAARAAAEVRPTPILVAYRADTTRRRRAHRAERWFQ